MGLILVNLLVWGFFAVVCGAQGAPKLVIIRNCYWLWDKWPVDKIWKFEKESLVSISISLLIRWIRCANTKYTAGLKLSADFHFRFISWCALAHSIVMQSHSGDCWYENTVLWFMTFATYIAFSTLYIFCHWLIDKSETCK